MKRKALHGDKLMHVSI